VLKLRWLIILGFSIALSACAKPDPSMTQQTFYVFGTEVSLIIADVPAEQAQAAIQAIEQRFQRFHSEWHAWEKGGIVSRINQAIRQGESIEVSDEIKTFIEKTQKLSAQSDYLFDPAIGQLIKMWGFHGEHWQGPPPSDAERQAWLKTRPSINDIYFDGHQLFSRNPNVQLDFGGNAKGLALDLASAILQQHGIQNAMLNIGGDIKVLGHKANQQVWFIGIQDPKNPTQAIAKIHARDGDSVFTSGTYQRYYQWQGHTFSHIINPNTAWPADSFASVTVIHPDATTADTAATALLIAGPKDWQRIAAQMGIDNALLIDREGHIQQTPSMQAYVELKN
jgi:thiamine biosynthesis lipoprotein